jgi:hypothetical protein
MYRAKSNPEAVIVACQSLVLEDLTPARKMASQLADRRARFRPLAPRPSSAAAEAVKRCSTARIARTFSNRCASD